MAILASPERILLFSAEYHTNNSELDDDYTGFVAGVGDQLLDGPNLHSVCRGGRHNRGDESLLE